MMLESARLQNLGPAPEMRTVLELTGSRQVAHSALAVGAWEMETAVVALLKLYSTRTTCGEGCVAARAVEVNDISRCVQPTGVDDSQRL